MTEDQRGHPTSPRRAGLKVIEVTGPLTTHGVTPAEPELFSLTGKPFGSLTTVVSLTPSAPFGFRHLFASATTRSFRCWVQEIVPAFEK